LKEVRRGDIKKRRERVSLPQPSVAMKSFPRDAIEEDRRGATRKDRVYPSDITITV
jgi:hypothetical protein